MNVLARTLWLACGLAAVALVGLVLSGPPEVAASTPPPAGAGSEPDDDPEGADLSPDDAPSDETTGHAPRPAAPRSASASASARAALARALATDTADEYALVSVDALRRGDLGPSLLACVRGVMPGEAVASGDKFGVDMLTALDHVGINGDLAAMTGRFGGARWEVLSGATPRPYGREARIFGEGEGEIVGVWRDEVVVVGRGVAAVQAALDRIEGRAPPGRAAPAFTRSGGGELRGAVAAQSLIEPLSSFGDPGGGLRDALRAAGVVADYHVSVVNGGLQISVSLHAPGPATRAAEPAEPDEIPVEPEDALDAAEGVLKASVAALQSPAPEVAAGLPPFVGEILGGTRVQRTADGLSLEMDVPASALRALFAQCEALRSPPALIED
jgi:hypothetical protein